MSELVFLWLNYCHVESIYCENLNISSLKYVCFRDNETSTSPQKQNKTDILVIIQDFIIDQQECSYQRAFVSLCILLNLVCVYLWRWFFSIHPPEQRAHCAICTDRIWGLGRQGYKCINCKLLVHKKCHKLVTVECGRPMIQVRAVTNVTFISLMPWRGSLSSTTHTYCSLFLCWLYLMVNVAV